MSAKNKKERKKKMFDVSHIFRDSKSKNSKLFNFEKCGIFRQFQRIFNNKFDECFWKFKK